MSQRAVQFLVGVAILGGSLRAHHSLSGAYDTSREVTVSGIIKLFQFVNPHPFITVEVEGANHEKQNWRMEMDNRSELVEIGMSSNTLKPGDRVVVTGSPGRSQSEILYIRRLDRPEDGLRYEQIGTTPRIQNPGKPRS